MLILMQFQCEYPSLCSSAFPDSMYHAHLQAGITPGVVLAKKILPLILLPYSLLGKVQAACMKYSTKMKYCSLRVGNNEAVTFIWGEKGKYHHSPFFGRCPPVPWVLSVILLPCSSCHSLPSSNVASAVDRSSA